MSPQSTLDISSGEDEGEQEIPRCDRCQSSAVQPPSTMRVESPSAGSA